MVARQTLAALALVAGIGLAPLRSNAGVFISVNIAPPAIPVYQQPFCPGPDYIWTPGFWQWDASVADYYWVPGTWVMAPQAGFLWTPGYWGFGNGAYLWHAGYWGPHIGFYGGVNYGFGYFGSGFSGGYWNGPHFFYNTAVSRVNVNVIHNTYVHNVTVVNNVHVSYNGGPGGVSARPTPGEQATLRESHIAPTDVQTAHAQFARQDRSQFASANHGVPPAAALARPSQSAAAFHANAAPATAPGGQYNRSGNGFNNSQRGYASTSQNGMRPELQQHTASQPNYANRPAPEARSTPEARPAPAPREESHGEERGRR